MSETPPGWYPDPSGNPGTRFWDGQAWTDNFQPAAGQAPPPPPAPKKGGKCKWVALGLVGLLVVAAALGGSSDTEEPESTGGSGQAAEQTDRPKSKDCGTKATGDCTPRVGPNGSVRVDALTWRIESARSTTELGDQTYGLGEEADGVFVIVKLQVTSDHDESVTLTDNVVKLETGGVTYDPDLEGTTAALGAGEEPFFLESLGPDSTTTGTVVFDLPASKLAGKLELRFGELGFGETHGYIRLPELG